jgi:hypothetical protein
MKQLTALAFVITALESAATVYPIDPMPLRKLIMETEYIIIGHVVSVEEVKNKKDAFANSIAHIRIREVLQGKISDTVVQVSFNPYLICPAPARYAENADVIAFLQKSKNGRFITESLSYGAKTLTLEEIAIYKERIIEMQQILKMSDQDERFIQTVEWLVRCAENDATRWEGTFELSPHSDFMSFYSRSEAQPFQYMLTSEQKLRLKNALLNSKSDYVSFGIVDLIYTEYQAEIYSYLVAALKNLSGHGLYFANEYMSRIMLKQRNEKLEQLAKEFEAIQFDYEKSAEKRRIINSFVALIEE